MTDEKPTQQEEYLTTSEVVRELNTTRQTLYDWMKRGIIEPVNIYSKAYRRRPALKFRRSDVDKLKPAERIDDSEEDKPPKNSAAA